MLNPYLVILGIIISLTTFSLLADFLAGVPTIINAYQNSQSESTLVYIFTDISAIITLLTVKIWTFAQYAFPVYIAAMCLVTLILIASPRRHRQLNLKTEQLT